MMGLQGSLLRYPGDFAKIAEQIALLREQVPDPDDVFVTVPYFLAGLDKHRQSCSVAGWDGTRLVGILFASEHCRFNWRSGYSSGGDFTGRGLLLCQPQDQTAVVQTAVDLLFTKGIHSLHLRLSTASKLPFPVTRLHSQSLSAIISGDVMKFEPDFEAFLNRLGPDTRRNIRRYRRQASAAGILFDPEVGAEDLFRERRRLNRQTKFIKSEPLMKRDERVMDRIGAPLRFALRSAEGSIVSLLCGFALGRRAYLLNQWNDVHLEKLSLSLVLRAYVFEHLIAAGYYDVQFIGGTPKMFRRYCIPQPYASFMFDRPTGLYAWLKQMLARYAESRRENKRPLPLVAESFCGSFIGDASLTDRTAMTHAIDAPPFSTSAFDQAPAAIHLEAHVPVVREAVNGPKLTVGDL